MSINYIPVNDPLLDGNEKLYLNECIESGWISSEGPFVKRFEDEFAAKVGRKFAVAVSNGTVAIDAAITSLGISKGDEVIMPTFTIISCINQIIRLGAKPVLVDSDPLTWNMDINQIESKITNKTRAIMIVHIYGLTVDVDPVLKIANKYGLKVIEDAAEMHGQTYKGRFCGSFGDISTFSFYPNKHITTGEGGMILTDNEEFYNRCQSLRNLCFQPKKRFVHDELGWNMRMTNMQAAIGVAQLERLDSFVERKRQMGKTYTNLLRSLEEHIILPLERTEYSENIYWIYGLILKDHVPFTPEEAMQKLQNLGVGTRPFFYPMHQQPYFQNTGLFHGESYPVAEWLSRRGFYIPSGLALTIDQMEEVTTRIKKIF